MAPTLILTQGDPAGIGPEIILRLAFEPPSARWRPLLVAERAALEALRPALPDAPWERLRYLVPHEVEEHAVVDSEILVVEPATPSSTERRVVPGAPSAADARGALAALDLGIDLVRRGAGDALVTAPLSKLEIVRHLEDELRGRGVHGHDFRGHTDYLARGAGLTRYGRDYLMAFLSKRLKVALLSTHVPLRAAIDAVTEDAVFEALRLLGRHVEGRIVVAGLDPHAGEGGLLGTVDRDQVAPAVARARAAGVDAHGPESADSLFARAADGEFDWVLALYHDQGLIAVKTAAFGEATNWTLGLPYLRTSVDHGTAYGIAGRGVARLDSLRAVIESTLELLASRRA